MGMKVTKDMSIFDGKTLVGYNLNHGHEYVLYLEDKDGKQERVRISGAMKSIFEQFLDIEINGVEAA